MQNMTKLEQSIELLKEISVGEKSEPLISIIVPVYNVEQYLAKCVQSIIGQTYRNLEIILVDDGSTDSCSALCDKFALQDSRIHVIHKRNGGLVSARKAGFTAATGDYIMSVDSDDWIESAMCEELLSLLMQSGAECAVSGYIHETVDNTKKLFSLKDAVFNLDDSSRASVMEGWLLGRQDIISPIVAKLYPACLIKQSYSNVPDAMSQGEDLANFVNLIAMAHSIICTEKTYYHYVYRKDSYSNAITPHEFTNLHNMIAYCRNTILQKYPCINKKIVDTWVIGQCIGDLKRINGVSEFYVQTYTFASPQMLVGKTIVIYGAGVVGKDYYSQLRRYDGIYISGWVDKNYKIYSYEWKHVEPVDSLLKKDYDIILIAVKKDEMAAQIKKELVQMGIAPEKIIWQPPLSVLDCMTECDDIKRGGVQQYSVNCAADVLSHALPVQEAA